MLADVIPLYPLYALFFADSGLSDAQISVLFIIWSTVSVITDVPSGAFADRFGRRRSLVLASLVQAAGYALWIALPGFAGFALGFVLWGISGSLISGAMEALFYEGLSAVGAKEHYAHLIGRITAAGLIAQVPAALLATVLFDLGGYEVAGWVSVGMCVLTALVASRLPEHQLTPETPDEEQELGYFATLRSGLREAVAPSIRAALIAVSVVNGIDGLEEYFSLMAQDWGVPVGVIPLAILGIPLAGAAGAAMGARAAKLSDRALGGLFVISFGLVAVAGWISKPVGLLVVALLYGIYRAVLVVVDARLQDRIEGAARATVTSVAGVGIELGALVVFGAWALGGLFAVAGVGVVVGLALPHWLRLTASGTDPEHS